MKNAIGNPIADQMVRQKVGAAHCLPFGGQLAEIVGVEAAGKVDGTGAGLGQFQAGVDGILHGVDADDEQRDLAVVGAGGAAGPDRDGRTATALDRPGAAGKAGAAELVGHLGVMAAT
jgi:hypothetical protein